MASRVQVIESVEDNLKLLEEGDVELGILDIVMVGLDLDCRIEFACRLFRNLVAGRQSRVPWDRRTF